MRISRFSLLSLFVSDLAFCPALGKTCERLQRSLTYTQEEAPRDLSGVLPVVVARVNQELEGVVNVEVGYHGDDLQGKVGQHLVKCEVTRLASVVPDDAKAHSFVDDMDRHVVSQCFEVPFTILDTNECTLLLGHPLRHQCQAPAECVNTDGSYDCVCPRMGAEEHLSPRSSSSETVDEQFWLDLAQQDRDAWEVSYNESTRTSCPSMPSTHGCCPVRTNTKDAMTCRSTFHCPKNPCSASNDCSSSATCVRMASPNLDPNYECQCPEGFMGNGRKCRPRIDPKPEPKVRFDGVTPTEETIKNDYYCDCTIPIMDACSGFPPCKGKHEICIVTASKQPQCGCEPGYVKHEKYGCVDESPPLMKLRNDPQGDMTLRLKQGEVYKEEAVDIQDENAEEYMRSLKIAYSIPLPYGCLTKVGEFHVNYTIATPWTSPAFVRLTRRVIIEDTDECSLNVTEYEQRCPRLVPKCDTEAGATCINKIGTYTCQCPKFTSGDGFLKGLSYAEDEVPGGYQGGTGCHDTSKPVVELKGPNPKVFRIARCGLLSGVMGSNKDDREAELKNAQQRHYEDDVKFMIRRTSGAELCATHSFSNPTASDCVVAYDETYNGKVDLSREVIVGNPVRTSKLRWRVPYDVKDEAGNKAETVWRDVVVEEVDLHTVEAKVRSESLEDKNAEIKKAVDVALAEERKKNGSRRKAPVVECPKCPVFDCSGSDSFDLLKCASVCEQYQQQTCSVQQELSHAVLMVQWLESLFPPGLFTVMFVFLVLSAAYVFLSFVCRLLFVPQYYSPAYDPEERERGLQNHITEFPAQQPQNGGMNDMRRSPPLGPGGGLPPPNQGMGMGPPTMSSSLYGSPAPMFAPSSRDWGQPTVSFQSPSSVGMVQEEPDIYQRRSPIITPSSRQGVGARQRSPYGR